MSKKANIYVATIFAEKPKQWGLRGDPYLWDDMKQAFSTVSFPISNEEFIKKFKKTFLELTGVPLTSDCRVFLAQYSHGGMSSGEVCGKFWNETALPLLLERLSAM